VDFEKLAVKLIDLAGERDPYFIEIAPGVPVHFNMYGFPYWYQKHGYQDLSIEKIMDRIFDKEQRLQYLEYLKVWQRKKFPKGWIPTIRKAVVARRELGMAIALDVFSTCYAVVANTPEGEVVAKANGFFTESGLRGYAPMNAQEIISFIDMVMQVPKLQELFLEAATKEIHHVGGFEYGSLVWLLEKNNHLETPVIDWGCGSGKSIQSIEEYLSGEIFAYDMQEIPNTFKAWDAPETRVRFAKIEPFSLPHSEDSIGAVLMMSVAGIWEPQALTKILAECWRVLKQDGAIYVAPLDFPIKHHFNDSSLQVGIWRKTVDGFEQIWPNI
jgi:hypothetical protein